MLRSDSDHHAHRCPRCTLPTRWCICEGLQTVSCPISATVLIHELEARRPTSTGHLLGRLLPNSRLIEWKPGEELAPESVREPGKELWIIHPNGNPLPAPGSVDLTTVQAVMIDGSWKQATAMMKTLIGWGRKVRLATYPESRYWRRKPQAPGLVSTAEAFIILVRALGEAQVADELSLRFELHVYAVLCARGEKKAAAEYLEQSPIATAHPELVARLNHCRKDYFY